MARYHYVKSTGKTNVTVTLTDREKQPVTVYTAETGSAPQPNPYVDADGIIDFWVNPGTVVVVTIGTGANTSVFDTLIVPSEEGAGGISSGSGLPPGGAAGETLFKVSADDGDAAWAEAITEVNVVREWVSPQLYFSEAFLAGVPAWVTTTLGGGATLVTPPAAVTVASTLGASKPAYTNCLNAPGPGGTTSAFVQDNNVSIAAMRDWTGITVTRAKFWYSYQRPATGGTLTGDILVDGVVQQTDNPAVAGTGTNWVQKDYAANKASTIKFRTTKTTGIALAASNGHYVTGVEVYGTPQPYMIGEVVRYQSNFYRSLQDNNPYTPGSGQGWVQV